MLGKTRGDLLIRLCCVILMLIFLVRCPISLMILLMNRFVMLLGPTCLLNDILLMDLKVRLEDLVLDGFNRCRFMVTFLLLDRLLIVIILFKLCLWMVKCALLLVLTWIRICRNLNCGLLLLKRKFPCRWMA